MPVARFFPLLLVLALLPVLSGCGAGVITGVITGNQNSGNAPPPVASPPTLTPVESTMIPLVRGERQFRLIVINNYQAPTGAEVRVEIEGMGVVVEQDIPFVLSVDANANSSTIGYAANLEPIEDLVTPGDGDVAAVLRVFVDGVQVGASVPMTLVGQRILRHDPLGGMATSFVPVVGGRPVVFTISGRPGEDVPEFDVQFAEPSQPLREATVNDVVPVPGRVPGVPDWQILAQAPPGVFPSVVNVVVVDALAGLSTLVSNIAYVPHIDTTSPTFGATNGTSPMVLIGRGLAPLTIPADPRSGADLSKVSVDFVKGGRVLTVPGSALAPRSNFSTLGFVVPPTPDGLPGPCDIVIRIDLGTVELRADAPDAFTYRHPDPGFGPRGAPLSDVPAALRLAAIEADPSVAPDIVALSSIGGYPRAELLVARQNGMFASFGPRIQGGQPPNGAQSLPADLAVGDFDNDADADVLLLNAGDGNGAEHNLLTGEGVPLPPLQLSSVHVPDAEGGKVISLTGDVTGDQIPDAVLIPYTGATGSAPRVLVSNPILAVPGFLVRPLALPTGSEIETNSPYGAAALGDIDDDGLLDIVAAKIDTATAAPTIRLVLAHGTGTGVFLDQQVLDVVVPGYAPDASAPVVGVHIIDTLGRRPIAVVLAGLDPSDPNAVNTPPAVATLLPDVATTRAYLPLTATEVVTYPAAQPFAASSFGGLDGTRPGELVLASGPGVGPPLRLMQWNGTALAEVMGAFEPAVEAPGVIRSVSMGLAVPQDGSRVPDPVTGVFVHHSQLGVQEDRVSTWFARDEGGQLRLVAPDASLELGEPHLGVALGNFSGQQLGASVEARDLCIATPSGLEAFHNDGVGGFLSVDTQAQPAIAARSLIAAEATQELVQLVAFLTTDGRLGAWRPSGTANAPVLIDLLQYVPAGPWTVLSTSHVMASDVDGDNGEDLVVALVLEDAAANRETYVLLFRGRRSLPGPGEFPFEIPELTAVTRILGEATSTAVGQFTDEQATNAFEVAMAFPYDGNEIRFLKYDGGPPSPPNPRDDRLVEQTTMAKTGLIAGEKPLLVVAANFDGDGQGDGFDDLAVASEGDRKLRVLINGGQFGAEVDPDLFFESPGVPPLPAGAPTSMSTGDFDGDGIPDLLVATSDSDLQLDQQFARYLSSGTGALASPSLLLPERTGNTVGGLKRDADAYWDLADVNWDGFPDLVIGWATTGSGDRNLRVLFGSAR